MLLKLGRNPVKVFQSQVPSRERKEAPVRMFNIIDQGDIRLFIYGKKAAGLVTKKYEEKLKITKLKTVLLMRCKYKSFSIN